ncbi:MAG: helix-turn-helix domain-containing protein [Oscillospiraceae bacterium]|nr:helix-turn-helix domain-containing protein [Oscillospiraceae bacterium]MBQ8338587.1 helix-turn-helix domain-containing protein [Oscillospiraceae bacterium]
MSDFYETYLSLCNKKGVTPSRAALEMGISKVAVSNWKARRNCATDANLKKIADYFGVSIEYLKSEEGNKKIPSPNITDDYTTFAVIGEVAAGYDSIAVEDWEGETIDIPNTYLRGRSKGDYFVLKVKGDSMYPAYQDGDKVLVLKQSTLNYSGQVGVILYDDDYASLKKVEYMQGEDWLRMVPINPAHPIKKVVGEQLEHCRILGIPKLLIREIED